MEFGAPPDAVELYDTRTLYWPPTRDRRQLWLVRYTYRHDPGEDVRIAMVGSTTFALFGETTAELLPAAEYALHRRSQLEPHEQPVAPDQPDNASWPEIH